MKKSKYIQIGILLSLIGIILTLFMNNWKITVVGLLVFITLSDLYVGYVAIVNPLEEINNLTKDFFKRD